jgi:hypothetical protein
MTFTGQILALDLASTSGWALGTLDDKWPRSGSIQWAKDGASMARIFSECRVQLRDFLSMHPEIKVVVFESPLLPMFKNKNTNFQTTRILIGLCAVVEELLYSIGSYDIREARVADVRNYFLGSNKHRREIAKAKTVQMCKSLGWEPCDDNAADALALWDYQRSLFVKELMRRRGA